MPQQRVRGNHSEKRVRGCNQHPTLSHQSVATEKSQLGDMQSTTNRAAFPPPPDPRAKEHPPDTRARGEREIPVSKRLLQELPSERLNRDDMMQRKRCRVKYEGCEILRDG